MPYKWSKTKGCRVFFQRTYSPLLTREDKAHLKHLKGINRGGFPLTPALPPSLLSVEGERLPPKVVGQ
jgi:hypothetical protein